VRTKNTGPTGSNGMGIALLSAAVFVAPACQDQAPPPLAELTTSHAALTAGEVLRLGSLGIELMTALHADPDEFECPSISSADNVHVLDYGGGCPPSSGSTSQGISGQVEFTVAPSTGWFVGNFDGIGFSGHTVGGELSGSYTLIGEQILFDLQFTGVQRTDRDDLSLNALFQVEGTDGTFVVDVDGGLLIGPSLPDTSVSLLEVTVQNGSLDSCVHPTAGSVELRRGTQTGSFEFSSDSASSGNVPFTLDGALHSSLPICP